MKESGFILVPSLTIGGQERQALVISQCLAEDYDMTMVIFSNTKPSYTENCRLINLDIPPRKGRIGKVIQQLRRASALRRLRKQVRPAFVYSLGPTANLTNVLSMGTGTCIVSLRSIMDASYSRMNSYIFSKAAIIVCQTKAMRQSFISQFGDAYLHKTAVVNNGYDIEAIRKKADSANPFDVDFRYIVTVGRLDPLKGYRQLLKAYALIHKRVPKLKLMFVGLGSLQCALEALCLDLKIQDSVVFNGYADNPYVYYRNALFVVLPSISEGFPNALAEAMICGAPVIAADCKTGPREMLSDSDTDRVTDVVEYAEYGILVPPFLSDTSDEPEKVKLLAQAMERMMTDETLRKHYAQAATERSEAFSVEKFRKNIVSVIERKETL